MAKLRSPKSLSSAKAAADQDALVTRATRLAAVHGLLVHAAIDLGVKTAVDVSGPRATTSSKLTRTFLDVVQARDALGEILEEIYPPLMWANSGNKNIPFSIVRLMALQAISNGRRDWGFMESQQIQKQMQALNGGSSNNGRDEDE